ncbi:MAG: ABC transporter permease [bacterium]|nr:ABC transporter permease [bacterium]
MTSLAISSVMNRKVRSAISVLAVALGVSTMLVLFGLAYGSLDEVANRIKGVGADIIIQRSSTPVMLGVRTGVMDEKVADDLKELTIIYEGETIHPIETASPVLIWVSDLGARTQNVYGIDPENFPAFGDSMEDALVSGRIMKGSHEIVIDEKLAAGDNLKAGDDVEMMGDTFTVTGIITAGAGARVFMDIHGLQDLTEEHGKCSALFVQCKHPKYVSDTAAAIEKEFPGLRPTTMEHLSKTMAESMAGLDQFIGAIIGVALAISSLVILLAMYTTIVERTREIGILKALGASKRFIIRNIMTETLLLCSIGVVIGVAFSWGVKYLLMAIYPLLTVEITWERVFWAAVLGLVVGVIAGIYPAYMAASKDPIKALQYE